MVARILSPIVVGHCSPLKDLKSDSIRRIFGEFYVFSTVFLLKDQFPGLVRANPSIFPRNTIVVHFPPSGDLRFTSCATGKTEKCNFRPPFAELEHPHHKVRLGREPMSYQFMQVGGNDARPNGIEWDAAVQWNARIPCRHEGNLQ